MFTFYTLVHIQDNIRSRRQVQEDICAGLSKDALFVLQFMTQQFNPLYLAIECNHLEVPARGIVVLFHSSEVTNK